MAEMTQGARAKRRVLRTVPWGQPAIEQVPEGGREEVAGRRKM